MKRWQLYNYNQNRWYVCVYVCMDGVYMQYANELAQWM